ncbi:MAG: hypothetical protein LBH05_03015 [Deferribacteraceae bacterium]|jgi:hypothetical protein|nr:hypothetical protein [Deferribacteraceae bacterium]
MIIKWSLMALTAGSTAGIGLFIFGSMNNFREWSGKSYPFFTGTAFVLMLTGLVIHIMGLGTPSNLLGMLSHITTGFSMATIGTVLLVVLLFIIAIRSSMGKSTPKWMPIFGFILSVCVCYGLSLVYTKASRPALNHWFIPLYIAAVTCLSGSYGHIFFRRPYFRSGAVVRFMFLAMTISAVAGFLINLKIIDTADRYLNMQIINSNMAWCFYGGTVIIGLGGPLMAELALKFSKRGRIFTLAGWIGTFIGSISFFTIINILG